MRPLISDAAADPARMIGGIYRTDWTARNALHILPRVSASDDISECVKRVREHQLQGLGGKTRVCEHQCRRELHTWSLFGPDNGELSDG
jgi:hypothetical protein